MGVPEIGRQDGQSSFGVLTVAVPAQQRLDRKSVAKIVQARPAAVVYATQPNLPGQGVERPVHLAFVQLVTVFIHQERAFGERTKTAVPAFRIIGEDLTG